MRRSAGAKRRARISLGLVELRMSPPKSSPSCRIISQAWTRIVKRGQRSDPRTSDLSILRVPVALEVGDQRRAKVTIGLLARINGGVTPEEIQRLLANPKGATIADGADRAGAGETLDDA